MSQQSASAELSLYEQDETAWLEQTATLIAQGRLDEVDHANLSGYLTDMARRDRREVLSRLVVLMVHLLKWEHQPEKRTGSWDATITHQRGELRDLLESRTLENHGREVLAKAYERAVKEAAREIGADPNGFPSVCAWSLDQILSES
jgi:Domain of unknown function DUF29